MTKLVERAKGMLCGAKKRVMYVLSFAVMSSIMAMTALAADTTEGGIDLAQVQDKMVVSFTDVAASIMSMLLALVPVVMSVLSMFLLIKYGIKFFQKMTGTAAN